MKTLFLFFIESLFIRLVFMKINNILFLFLLMNCHSFSFTEQKQNHFIILTYNEKVSSVKILMEELEIPAEIIKTSEPYTHNSFAVLSIGENFPYDKFIEILGFIKNYYPELRYIDLIQKKDKVPDNILYQLYIGASTEIAIKKNLKAWNQKDFEELKKIKNHEEMIQVILNKNQRN